ncbi:MAG TPA: inositol monophosphatase family protein [Thermoanaerobaculia bacterium]|nr:inositol monophosphatase family protein [Thermoanaerobaculia bacterium]
MSSRLLETAIAAARAGGELLLARWRALPQGAISQKRQNDFVTLADYESEQSIIAVIRERFPDDAFLAEEGGGGGRAPEGRRTWIIDPLDGTSNFIAGFPFWCVSIAASERGEPVAGVVWDPLRGELYAGERGAGAFRNETRLTVTERQGVEGSFLATGFPFRCRDKIDVYLALFRALFLEARAIRRAGSAALDLANVAAGVFDGFFEFRLSPWDIAAGAVLIEEAGGVLTDFGGGRRYFERGNVVAGSRGVAEGIRQIASTILSEDGI